MRERSFIIPRPGTDITTFGEGEEFRIASKSSSAPNSRWAVAQALAIYYTLSC